MTKYTDHAAAVTVQLIDTITTTSPGHWQAPWHHNGSSVWAPRNATTNRGYRGGNTIALAIQALNHGYQSGDWATYRQWGSVDAQVRKGERGTRCVRWVKKEAEDTKPGEPEIKEGTSRMVPVMFTVFNADQVDGYEPHATSPNPIDTVAQVDTDVKATGAVILHGGDRAFYRPAADVIQLPDFERFTSTAGYYGTCLHELAHWTGHQSRKARDFGGRYGDDAYAIEELTAELAAAMLTAHYGLANEARSDHADYLGSWLRIMGAKPDTLLSVANQAQAAADFILSTSPSTGDVESAGGGEAPVLAKAAA